MKILFSPSESKSDFMQSPSFDINSFCCKDLFQKRMDVANKYQDILDSHNIEKLKKLFGLKDEKKCLNLANINIKKSLTCKAIKRYIGVAYNYLNYDTIPKNKQVVIDENLIIFSNLFGPILAKDKLPMYKLKQGSTLDGFKIENYYKEYFSSELDKILKDEFIIDLRAGFYEKFYTIPYPYITMKFIKNEKVVSHWAKAYRGIILRNIALNSVYTLDDFKNLYIENLMIKEIRKTGIKTEFIYEISS